MGSSTGLFFVAKGLQDVVGVGEGWGAGGGQERCELNVACCFVGGGRDGIDCVAGD